MTSRTDELLTRGVENVVPKSIALEKIARGSPMRIYMGIDPTGTKLHLGHSVPLRKLRALVEHGHHVIFLIGSFTAMIGDPSGRDKMRESLTKEQVVQNFESYKQQASAILDFSKVELRYNHEWLDQLDGQMMMKLAANFTVQQMLERDMFVKRAKEGNPIAIVEFLYPMLVGYDSVVLDVDCELGGSDQLFNMLAGRTLQKAFGKRDKFVLTTKLIEGTDGRKMSKTYDNCIWLTDTAADMYGKTMSIRDDLICTYMECCTDIPMAEIEEVKERMSSGGNPREEKARLAREITTIYHGAEAAAVAEKEFTNVFTKGALPDAMPELTGREDALLVDMLHEANIVPSKSEARRLLKQGAIQRDDHVVRDPFAKADRGVYRIGKRKFVKIV